VPEAAQADTNLLNVSYDVSREFYKAYNVAFAKHWKQTTGEDGASTSRTAAPASRRAASLPAWRPMSSP
jgi:sulfate transport system substrate-binding protein